MPPVFLNPRMSPYTLSVIIILPLSQASSFPLGSTRYILSFTNPMLTVMGRKCIDSLWPLGSRNELNHNIAAIMQRSMRFPSWCNICKSSLTRHTASPILIQSDSVFIAFALAIVFSSSLVISRETSLPKVLHPNPSRLSKFLCAMGKKLQCISRNPSCGRSV